MLFINGGLVSNLNNRVIVFNYVLQNYQFANKIISDNFYLRIEIKEKLHWNVFLYRIIWFDKSKVLVSENLKFSFLMYEMYICNLFIKDKLLYESIFQRFYNLKILELIILIKFRSSSMMSLFLFLLHFPPEFHASINNNESSVERNIESS